jgi:hypothetical protein
MIKKIGLVNIMILFAALGLYLIIYIQANHPVTVCCYHSGSSAANYSLETYQVPQEKITTWMHHLSMYKVHFSEAKMPGQNASKKAWSYYSFYWKKDIYYFYPDTKKKSGKRASNEVKWNEKEREDTTGNMHRIRGMYYDNNGTGHASESVWYQVKSALSVKTYLSE